MSGFARSLPGLKKAASMQNSAGISSSSALRAREEDGQPGTEPSLHTNRTYEVFFSTGLRKASAKTSKLTIWKTLRIWRNVCLR